MRCSFCLFPALTCFVVGTRYLPATPLADTLVAMAQGDVVWVPNLPNDVFEPMEPSDYYAISDISPQTAGTMAPGRATTLLRDIAEVMRFKAHHDAVPLAFPVRQNK